MTIRGKDTFPKLTDRQKQQLALVFIALAFVGFLLSRPLLSIATIALGAIGLYGHHPRQWLRNTYWLLGIAWLAALFLTGLPSYQRDSFWMLMQVKLPIMLLPLSFSLLPAFTLYQKKLVTAILVVALFIGMTYSTYFFIQDSAALIKGYATSKVLPTLVEADHIRFSMAVAFMVNWCLYMLLYCKPKWEKLLLLFIVMLATLFLHLLAARTGLLLLYISCGGWLIFLVSKWKWQKSLALTAAFISLIVLSYHYVPTIKGKLGYTRYTLQQYVQGNRSPNYSDLGRILSWQAGKHLFLQSPLYGVGLGNVLPEAKHYYQKELPHEEAKDLLPHNEWLLQAAAGGILTLLLFMLWQLYPLRRLKRNPQSLHLFLVWLMLSIGLMIEPLLEIQMGVFVFSFFLLWATKEQHDALPLAHSTIA